jgi:hypothetical protein
MTEEIKSQNKPERKDVVTSLANPETIKENAKALLYLACGKLDSNIKAFKNKIIINKEDLIELNDFVCEKLRNHDVTVSKTSVNFSFNQNKVTHFGVWAEFTDANFSIPDVTEDITLIWDFFVVMPSHAQPLRHTLTVKISSDLSMAKIFPILVKGDINEIDEAELRSFPIICQIDFINFILGDELISVVTKWVDGRKVALVVTGLKQKLQNFKKIIAQCIHYSIPTIFTFVLLAFLRFEYRDVSVSNQVTIGDMLYFMYWLLTSAVIILVSQKIAKFLANRSYVAISKYGEFRIFNITNGDKNKVNEIERKNSKEFRKFIFECAVAFIINLAAGVLLFILLR